MNTFRWNLACKRLYCLLFLNLFSSLYQVIQLSGCKNVSKHLYQVCYTEVVEVCSADVIRGVYYTGVYYSTGVIEVCIVLQRHQRKTSLVLQHRLLRSTTRQSRWLLSAAWPTLSAQSSLLPAPSRSCPHNSMLAASSLRTRSVQNISLPARSWCARSVWVTACRWQSIFRQQTS